MALQSFDVHQGLVPQVHQLPLLDLESKVLDIDESTE